jgi:hypothetical protein
MQNLLPQNFGTYPLATGFHQILFGLSAVTSSMCEIRVTTLREGRKGLYKLWRNEKVATTKRLVHVRLSVTYRRMHCSAVDWGNSEL